MSGGYLAWRIRVDVDSVLGVLAVPFDETLDGVHRLFGDTAVLFNPTPFSCPSDNSSAGSTRSGSSPFTMMVGSSERTSPTMICSSVKRVENSFEYSLLRLRLVVDGRPTHRAMARDSAQFRREIVQERIRFPVWEPLEFGEVGEGLQIRFREKDGHDSPHQTIRAHALESPANLLSNLG